MALQLPNYPITKIIDNTPANAETLNAPHLDTDANFNYLKDELDPLVDNISVDTEGGVTIANSFIVNGAMTMSRNQGLRISNNDSNTLVDITAEYLTLFDNNNLGMIVRNVGLQADIANTAAGINKRDIADAIIGEKANTWYGIWVISNETITASLLVANVKGTCDNNTTNKLTDSSKNFYDEGVQVGDTVYNGNSPNFGMGYVQAIDSNTVLSIGKIDGTDLDLFPDGNEIYTIERMSPIMPEGYTFKKYLGSLYNDADSNIADFTQIDNEVSIPTTSIVLEVTEEIYTYRSCAHALPTQATSASGTMSISTFTGGTSSRVAVASTIDGKGEQQLFFQVLGGLAVGTENRCPWEMLIAHPQYIALRGSSSNSFDLSVSHFNYTGII